MAVIKNKSINISQLVCPIPIQHYDSVVLGHGSGGQLTQELIDKIFLPAFSDKTIIATDAAVISVPNHQLAFSTDSFVVSPLFFPGGDIGSLAIHGTVNDLAMMGAKPLYISVGFILEEGLPIKTLIAIVNSMAAAADIAQVRIVTGDTKVVQKHHGDGVYINTSGVGVLLLDNYPHPCQIKTGDILLVNGTLGDHGMAIMSKRENLQFESEIISDSAPLNHLIEKVISVCPHVHALRDLTRGGLAAGLNELAKSAGVGMTIDENKIPVHPQVSSSCEIMGLDPLNIANEGKFIAAVAKNQANNILRLIRSHPLGKKAAIIGEVTSEHPGLVIGITPIGSKRVVDMPPGELLPRIC